MSALSAEYFQYQNQELLIECLICLIGNYDGVSTGRLFPHASPPNHPASNINVREKEKEREREREV